MCIDRIGLEMLGWGANAPPHHPWITPTGKVDIWMTKRFTALSPIRGILEITVVLP